MLFEFLFPTEKFQPEIFNQISMLWEQNAFVVPKHFYEEVHPGKKKNLYAVYFINIKTDHCGASEQKTE